MDDETNSAFKDFSQAVASAAQPEQTAAQRLRAFEDKHLGKDAVRLHGGRVERGSGSLYQRLSHAHRRAHAAIEKTAETEAELNTARAALAIAENKHSEACEAAASAEESVPEPVESEEG